MRHEQWIAYLERVLATAQIGLTYSKDRYDIARFETLRKETASILVPGVGGSLRAQTDETTDARYWSIEALPELSLHRVLPEQVRVLVDRLKRGERETLF